MSTIYTLSRWPSAPGPSTSVDVPRSCSPDDPSLTPPRTSSTDSTNPYERFFPEADAKTYARNKSACDLQVETGLPIDVIDAHYDELVAERASPTFSAAAFLDRVTKQDAEGERIERDRAEREFREEELRSGVIGAALFGIPLIIAALSIAVVGSLRRRRLLAEVVVVVGLGMLAFGATAKYDSSNRLTITAGVAMASAAMLSFRRHS